MTVDEVERRRQPRIELIRPCKVYDPRSRRYIAGATWNVSRTGVLLELQQTVPLVPGDRLFIGIAARRREVVLCRSEMVAATVSRALLTPQDQTVVALQLDAPLAVHVPRPAPLAA